MPHIGLFRNTFIVTIRIILNIKLKFVTIWVYVKNMFVLGQALRELNILKTIQTHIFIQNVGVSYQSAQSITTLK